MDRFLEKASLGVKQSRHFLGVLLLSRVMKVLFFHSKKVDFSGEVPSKSDTGFLDAALLPGGVGITKERFVWYIFVSGKGLAPLLRSQRENFPLAAGLLKIEKNQKRVFHPISLWDSMPRCSFLFIKNSW